MRVELDREELLAPLQAVVGVVERRQTMPILAMVLITAKDNQLQLTATDLEVELRSSKAIDIAEDGVIAAPARKLLDICRSLADNQRIVLDGDNEQLVVSSGRSRFKLACLKADDFPTTDDIAASAELNIAADKLSEVIKHTQFSMAQQDVRYYLNGILLELNDGFLRAVATDGHRLALSEIAMDIGDIDQRVIVPRKGVTELQRLLQDSDGEVAVSLSSNHIKVEGEEFRFVSKLIDGRFPEYQRVIPAQADNLIEADRQDLRQALSRASILSNEKYRGVRLRLSANNISIHANNPEQEEATEELAVEYSGEEMEIGFNAGYLLDAFAAVESDTLVLSVTDSSSSCLVRDKENSGARYVVMPMRL